MLPKNSFESVSFFTVAADANGVIFGALRRYAVEISKRYSLLTFTLFAGFGPCDHLVISKYRISGRKLL